MNFEQHDQYENTETTGKRAPDYFKDFTYNPEEEKEDVVVNRLSDTKNNTIYQKIIKETTPQIANLKQESFTPEKQSIIDTQFNNGLPYYLQASYQQRDLSQIA